MLCRLTNTYFDYKSSVSVGVHPEAFSYSLARLITKLETLLKYEKNIGPDKVFIIRLAVLYYLDERVGIKFGSVYYRPDEIKEEDFNVGEFITVARQTLKFFKEDTPNLKKLKIKNVPCKGTVESLQSIFFTHQSGENYTPFKQYLETTLLSEEAVEAIVNYYNHETPHNEMVMQMTLAGQESLLILSDKEVDYYNNRKLSKIKKIVEEFALDLPTMEYEDILNENGLRKENETPRGELPIPYFNIEIKTQG